MWREGRGSRAGEMWSKGGGEGWWRGGEREEVNYGDVEQGRRWGWVQM